MHIYGTCLLGHVNPYLQTLYIYSIFSHSWHPITFAPREAWSIGSGAAAAATSVVHLPVGAACELTSVAIVARSCCNHCRQHRPGAAAPAPVDCGRQTAEVNDARDDLGRVDRSDRSFVRFVVQRNSTISRRISVSSDDHASRSSSRPSTVHARNPFRHRAVGQAGRQASGRAGNAAGLHHVSPPVEMRSPLAADRTNVDFARCMRQVLLRCGVSASTDSPRIPIGSSHARPSRWSTSTCGDARVVVCYLVSFGRTAPRGRTRTRERTDGRTEGRLWKRRHRRRAIFYTPHAGLNITVTLMETCRELADWRRRSMWASDTMSRGDVDTNITRNDRFPYPGRPPYRTPWTDRNWGSCRSVIVVASLHCCCCCSCWSSCWCSIRRWRRTRARR